MNYLCISVISPCKRQLPITSAVPRSPINSVHVVFLSFPLSSSFLLHLLA